MVTNTSHDGVNKTIKAFEKLWNKHPCEKAIFPHISSCSLMRVSHIFLLPAEKFSQSLLNELFTFDVWVLFLIFYYAHKNHLLLWSSHMLKSSNRVKKNSCSRSVKINKRTWIENLCNSFMLRCEHVSVCLIQEPETSPCVLIRYLCLQTTLWMIAFEMWGFNDLLSAKNCLLFGRYQLIQQWVNCRAVHNNMKSIILDIALHIMWHFSRHC